MDEIRQESSRSGFEQKSTAAILPSNGQDTVQRQLNMNRWIAACFFVALCFLTQMFQANSDLFSNAKVKGLCLIHLLQFSIAVICVFIFGRARRRKAEHIT